MKNAFEEIQRFNWAFGNQRTGLFAHAVPQFQLIDEELLEYREAVVDRNVTKLRDALADLVVVSYGMAHRMGFALENLDLGTTEQPFALDKKQWWMAASEGYSAIQRIVASMFYAIEACEPMELEQQVMDVLVMLYFIAFRLQLPLDDDLEAVHKSNMSKFCNSEQEARETALKCLESGIETNIRHIGGLWSVVSSHLQTDSRGKEWPKGKLCKSVGYTDPKLRSIEVIYERGATA